MVKTAIKYPELFYRNCSLELWSELIYFQRNYTIMSVDVRAETIGLNTKLTTELGKMNV